MFNVVRPFLSYKTNKNQYKSLKLETAEQYK